MRREFLIGTDALRDIRCSCRAGAALDPRSTQDWPENLTPCFSNSSLRKLPGGGATASQHRRPSQDLVPKMEEDCSAGFLPNGVSMCGHQGVNRLSRRQRIDHRNVHREMLQCVLLQHLRHEVRPGLAPFHVSTQLLRGVVKLSNNMMPAGKLQNCAPDESAGAILPTKDDVILRHVARQADDVSISPPASVIVQQTIAKKVGERGNAACSRTAGIEKYPIPWKELRGIPEFNRRRERRCYGSCIE